MKDKIGIWSSFICLIHCLLFPLLATSFPIFLKLDIKVELFLLTISLIVGSLSFIDNYLKHKYLLSLILFFLGFLGIFTSLIFNIEIINILGLIILMISHYLNFKKIKEIDGCHPHGCKH